MFTSRQICAVCLLLIVSLWGSAVSAQCDSATECCVQTCSGATQLPTAEQCAADDCACAQQLQCYIAEREPNWALFPNSEEFEPTTRPVHGRYMTILVNMTAEAGLTQFAPGKPGPVELPSQSIIVKKNFPPDFDTPGVPDIDPSTAAITSMIKLDGYCPETSGAAEQCVGGDWFYLLQVGEILPQYGKPSGCTNCHAAAQRGDWSWRLFSARRFLQP
ncbi:MAG: hypothetical protein AAGA91_07325 [Pseudomonadota bacterium]